MTNKFKIFETKQYIKDIEDIFNGRVNKINQKLNNYIYPQLRENPYYGKNIKKLINYIPDTWRYRIGEYRLFYQIDDKDHIIYIIAIESRSNSYKKNKK